MTIDIRPRMVDGEPVCATLTCPVRETCPYRSVALVEADRPCVPSIRHQRDEALARAESAEAALRGGEEG